MPVWAGASGFGDAIWNDPVLDYVVTMDLPHPAIAERDVEEMAPLLRACVSDPADGLHARILADWLEDKGYPGPARALRSYPDVRGMIEFLLRDTAAPVWPHEWLVARFREFIQSLRWGD